MPNAIEEDNVTLLITYERTKCHPTKAPEEIMIPQRLFMTL